jgi:hypothetical protein
MQLALAMALCLSAPPETSLTDTVSVVEHSRVYDGDGKLIIDQLIFWIWHELSDRHEVVAWRLVDKIQFGIDRDWNRGDWVLTFTENDGTLRRIRALSYRESFRQYDVETEERQEMDVKWREGLRRPLTFK